MKTVNLKTATDERNGLKASNSDKNPFMFDVRKFSKTGRDNGLVARFNVKTGKVIFDGTSWRNYKPYKHMSIDDIEKALKQKLKFYTP